MEVVDAIKSIPNEEKRAYLMALAQCPHLLHRESCVERFLQSDSNQADKAARKFVDYWEKRRQVYENGAAFLRLALSEPKALPESCKSLLEAGWISPLPPDKYGRRVCLLNLSADKGSRHFSQEDKARCIFFVLQCLSEDPSAQTSGISLVVVYDNIPHTSPTTSIKALDEILQVMPVKVMSLNVIHAAKCGEDDNAFYESFVPIALKTMLNSPVDDDHDALLEQRSRIHVNKSRDEILKELQLDGLRRENLPSVLGGSWTSIHHEAWLKVRLQDERHGEAQPQGLGEFSFPGKEATTGRAAVGEVREKIRDAWHSKLKRARKRCRTKALQIRVNHLRNQQDKLKKSTKLLEQALKDANQIVATIEAHKGLPFAAGMPSHASAGSTSSASLSSMLYSGHHNMYGEDRRSLLELSSMRSDALSAAIRAEHEMLLLSRMSARPRFLTAFHPHHAAVQPSVYGSVHPSVYGSVHPPAAAYYPHTAPLLVSTREAAAPGGGLAMVSTNWRPVAVAPQGWTTNARSRQPTVWY